METRTGFSYGDVLLVSWRSPVNSRSDVDLSTNVTPDLCLDTPPVSAAMDTVTEAELMGTLSGLGGLGVVHHSPDVDERAEWVRRVAEAGGTVAGAVGISGDYLDRTEALLDAGADAIVMDAAHGHVELRFDVVERIQDEFGPEIAAGNVIAPVAAEDFWEAGVDCMKAGVRPGSHCTTREAVGAGYSQLAAVSECAEWAYNLGIRVMASGGIRTSGDAVKALMIGAGTVMMGSFFVRTSETPGRVVEVDGKTYKRSRRMASTGAADNYEDKQSDVDTGEGVKTPTPYKGPVEPLIEKFPGRIHSDVGHCGGHTLVDARKKASFVRVAASAKEREDARGVIFTEGPVKADEEVERELQALVAD